MDQLVSVAAFLRTQLEIVETKIKELSVPVISVEDIRQRIADKDEDPKWKSFVQKPFGVVDNILFILDDCYDSFVELIEENSKKNPCLVIGCPNSQEWKNYQIAVIEKLLDPKSFDKDYDFEDTATGCDEVVWDAAYDIIMENLEK